MLLQRANNAGGGAVRPVLALVGVPLPRQRFKVLLAASDDSASLARLETMGFWPLAASALSWV